MLYITRKEQFNAAHRLYNENYSNEKNLEVFGKCSNANWHGHNYDLFVTVKGNINKDTGFVVNLKLLSQIIKEFVILKVDHKNLNIDVEFMQGVNPSAENLCVKIWNQLEEPIEKLGIKLHKIQLFETEKNIVDYYGES